MRQFLLALTTVAIIGLVVVFMYYDRRYDEVRPADPVPSVSAPDSSSTPPVSSSTAPAPEPVAQEVTLFGFWECLPMKPDVTETSLECAVGIALDKSDGHVAIDTSALTNVPMDVPMGSKVMVTGVFTPVQELGTVQTYDIDGVLRVSQIGPVVNQKIEQ